MLEESSLIMHALVANIIVLDNLTLRRKHERRAQ